MDPKLAQRHGERLEPPPPAEFTPLPEYDGSSEAATEIEGGNADFELGATFGMANQADGSMSESTDENDDFELGADFATVVPEFAEADVPPVPSPPPPPPPPVEESSDVEPIPTVEESDEVEHAPIPEPSETMPPVAEAATEIADSSAEESKPTEESEASAPIATKSKKRSRDSKATSTAEPHSETTGGDALLDIALKEEQEGPNRKAGQEPPVRVDGGFIMTCPCPVHCRIKIRDQHCGKVGRCPNPSCDALVKVAANLGDQAIDTAGSDESASKKKVTAGAFPEGIGEEVKYGNFQRIIRDIRWLDIVPDKVKRKPGSLAKDGQAADVIFAPGEVLIVGLKGAGGGLFGGGKKPEEIRTAVRAHLEVKRPIADTPADSKIVLTPANLADVVVEQPTAFDEDSRFGGVPVFGEGRIAVRVPGDEEVDTLPYLSMTLTDFRAFAKLIGVSLDASEFGRKCPVPFEDQYENSVCHYNDTAIAAIQHEQYYREDPRFELKEAGWKCGSCGLTVSEDARKKEKIGGANGKGLPKAKCPKCNKVFGRNPLYAVEVKSPESTESGEDTTSDSEKAEAAAT
ncbi:hypothetical protein [Stratiformator vulcanicus]|nr:hypothetical protein [Stratiformator vulcanicus]